MALRYYIFGVIYMKYKSTVRGIFISRPNRFIAKVNIGGKEETVHVKNTGRCREILVPGATVYLEKAENPLRKTPYDLIAVEKKTKNGTILINTDSQVPNACAEEFLPRSGLFSENTVFRREVKFGNSRLDIFAEGNNRKAFIEIKGVTLEKDGIVLFPDAPTERGVKHIRELIKAKNDGYDAYIIFIAQMKGARCFTPNRETHPEFADALIEAARKGVKILCYGCTVTPGSIAISEEIPVKLT